MSGIYTVVEDPEVEARILANPDLLLAGSCELEDPDTYGKEAVATENPGTAIFEGGRGPPPRPRPLRLTNTEKARCLLRVAGLFFFNSPKIRRPYPEKSLFSYP